MPLWPKNDLVLVQLPHFTLQILAQDCGFTIMFDIFFGYKQTYNCHETQVSCWMGRVSETIYARLSECYLHPIWAPPETCGFQDNFYPSRLRVISHARPRCIQTFLIHIPKLMSSLNGFSSPTKWTLRKSKVHRQHLQKVMEVKTCMLYVCIYTFYCRSAWSIQ